MHIWQGTILQSCDRVATCRSAKATKRATRPIVREVRSDSGCTQQESKANIICMWRLSQNHDDEIGHGTCVIDSVHRCRLWDLQTDRLTRRDEWLHMYFVVFLLRLSLCVVPLNTLHSWLPPIIHVSTSSFGLEDTVSAEQWKKVVHFSSKDVRTISKYETVDEHWTFDEGATRELKLGSDFSLRREREDTRCFESYGYEITRPVPSLMSGQKWRYSEL